MTVLWVIVVIYGLSEGSNKNLKKIWAHFVSSKIEFAVVLWVRFSVRPAQCVRYTSLNSFSQMVFAGEQV